MISRIPFFFFCFPASYILTILSSLLLPFPNVCPISAISLSLCLLTVFSVITAITTSSARRRGGEEKKKKKKTREKRGRKKLERREAGLSNIGRVYFSLPQITAIKQPDQTLSHQFDSKH